MAQSKAFVGASHALNELSHELALLESENASLRGAADGLAAENAKLRELVKSIYTQYDGSIDWDEIERCMCDLGIEVDG